MKVERGYYRHWKEGTVYVVEQIVQHHETGQEWVIYRPYSGPGQYTRFCRLASEWFDPVPENQSNGQSVRFEKIEPPHGSNTSNVAEKPVLQDWVLRLPYMQQSVLVSAVRGADNLPKEHPSKAINRWLRRCFMLSAFDGHPLLRPDLPGGGSFTGPSINLPGTGTLTDDQCWSAMKQVAEDYFRTVDELPHHYQLHVLHAAEILGYKHPDDWCRQWWWEFYRVYVNKLHLYPEPEPVMDKRLGDRPRDWKGAEEQIPLKRKDSQ